MKVCDVCGGRYKDKGNPRLCPFDGTPLRDLPDPMLGRTIAGHYVITQKLGAGGFGTVFRARHEVLGRDVAIKFLNPDLAVDATNRSRFLREAKAANRIDHEHIIDITDYGETDDGMVYLVMELLQGRPLSADLANGPMSITRVIDISSQIAGALARAHELDVIHRDIKPDNIYLVEMGARRDFVKLLDFGLAHMKGELRLTATGAVFGTPEYMAPEQARGAPLTALADLYALGCVLFHMLTGALPFTGNTPDLILKHMREPAPLASQRAHGIPPELDALVRKLMEKDPKKRHRDAHHLLEELRKIGDALPSVRAPVSARGEPSGPRRRDAIMSIAPTATGAHLPSTLERRVQFFRELAARAHGSAPPPWLLQAIEELARRVTDARVLERELSESGAATSGRETEIRNMRLRLGGAIDELGRDESRAAGEIDDLYRRLAEARAQHQDAEPPLAKALSAIRAGGAIVTRDVAVALRDAGAVARSWLDAESEIDSIGQQLRVRERERDDLQFQVSQMKGRLGGMNAEQDVELGAMRAQNTDLDRRHGAISDEIAQRAAAITEHFAKFPELRDILHAEARPSR